jgi:MoaA/NifB/PqqE/SkfB family radical SAM enzyme
MALDDFCTIIDQIAPYAYRVELYNWGEPLLHPEIVEMVGYATRQRISVGLSSNLNRLDRVMAERLIETGLSQLTVSIDGATQPSYGAYRRGGSLEAVLTNLKMLIDARRALGRVTPLIIARMLVGKHNEHEIDVTRRLAEDVGVDSFSTGVLYVDTNDPEQVKQWLPQNPAYSAYQHTWSAERAAGELMNDLTNEWTCDDLWQSMVINWDGGVSPCCWLHDPQYDFGNTSKTSVRRIWNGAHYVSARRAIGGRKGRKFGPGATVSTICHRCRGHPHYMAY